MTDKLLSNETSRDSVISISVLSYRSSAVRTMRRAAEANGVSAAVAAFGGRRSLAAGCDILAAFDLRPTARHIAPPADCVAVLRSEDMRTRRVLGGRGIPCIVCGMSPFDTVTVSSLSRGRAMMTVQRELPTPGGGVIEPCELPLTFSGSDIHRALMTAAVLLLCLGEVPEVGITLRPPPQRPISVSR